MDSDRLYDLASTFRTAMEATLPEDFPDTLTLHHAGGFPRGCCGDTSVLLAEYLTQNGYTGVQLISADNGGDERELYSHAWLEVDGIVVDITADQFDDYDIPAVFVSDQSDFHDSFDQDEPRGTSLGDWDGMEAAYDYVVLLIGEVA